MFGKGLITGMRVTWKHFWGKKATFCYPEEKLPMTERFRGGHLVLNNQKCIGCKLCAFNCPNRALDLTVTVDENKKRHMQKYLHIMGRCLYCNICVENCPTHALSWDKEYAISSWYKEDMVHDSMPPQAAAPAPEPEVKPNE